MRRHPPEFHLDFSETRGSTTARLNTAPHKRERGSEFLLDFSLQAVTTGPTATRPSNNALKCDRESENPQGSLLRLTGGVPSSAMPKEGHRTWAINEVTQKQLDTTERLIIFGSPSSAQRLSLWRAFESGVTDRRLSLGPVARRSQFLGDTYTTPDSKPPRVLVTYAPSCSSRGERVT